MLDSLAIIVASLTINEHAAIVKWNQGYVPAPAKPIIVHAADVKPTESLTTCYVNADNTCWSR